MTTLQLIATRRCTLADQLDTLSDHHWEEPSLCDAWSVRDVVGHVVMPFTHSTAKVLAGVIRARGNWHRFSERAAQQNAQRPTAELVALLRDHAENPWAPPGGGLIGALTDLTVHSLDIARPCGIDPELDEETSTAVLENLVQPKALKAFGVDLAGLQLSATDADWHHGNGQPVLATGADLILAITGRPGASLDGEGAATMERAS